MTVFVFSIPFESINHTKSFISMSIHHSINMVLTSIDHVQRFSHLDIPTKYHYLTSIKILIATSKFFDTIIDVDY